MNENSEPISVLNNPLSAHIVLLGKTRKALYRASEAEQICERVDMEIYTETVRTIEEIQVYYYDDEYSEPFLNDLWLLMRGTPEEIDQGIRFDCPAASYNNSNIYPVLSSVGDDYQLSIVYPCFKQPYDYFANTRQYKLLISLQALIIPDMYGIKREDLIVLPAPSIKGDDN